MPAPKVDTESPPADDIHTEGRTSGSESPLDNKSAQNTTAAKLRNPLAGFTNDELIADADSFTEKYGLTEHREDFRKGALLAQAINRPDGFETIPGLSDDEKAVLRKEVTHRWAQPFQLYFLCGKFCLLCPWLLLE